MRTRTMLFRLVVMLCCVLLARSVHRVFAQGLVFDNPNSSVGGAGVSADPTPPANGSIWYETTKKTLRGRVALGSVGLVGVFFNTVSDSQTISNTTAETAFDQTFTIPANSLSAGKILRVTAWGIYSTASGTTPSLFMRMRYGGVPGTQIAGSTTLTTAVGAGSLGWRYSATIVIRAVGASGSANSFGEFMLNASPSQQGGSTNSSSGFDTTTAKTLGLTVSWGTANVSNTVTAQGVVYEMLN